MNLSIAAIGLIVTSSVLGHIGDFDGPPPADPIVTRESLRNSVEVRGALSQVETTHHAQCLDARPGKYAMYLLWTVQWSTARCALLDDPERSVQVTFRFTQGPNGVVRLRGTRVRPS